jgi:Arc/MetJ family transcription regulator
MRTTLDIDRQLLEAAVQALDARTKTEAVETALRECLAARRRRELVQALGSFDLAIGAADLARDRLDE